MAERQPVTYPVTVDTIGKLYDRCMQAFMYCRSRHRGADIDLPRLIGHVGREWVFIGRRWPVKCANCGSGDIETRILPETR
jgi:hypothetical protein